MVLGHLQETTVYDMLCLNAINFKMKLFTVSSSSQRVESKFIIVSIKVKSITFIGKINNEKNAKMINN